MVCYAIHGIKVAKNAPPVTHLLFAENTLFFCKVTLDEINLFIKSC